MITVNLRDGCFPDQYSATLAGDAAGERPTLLEWRRIAPGEGADSTVVFTDFCLSEAATSPARRKVAWLIEPPSINPVSYQTVYEMRHHFDAVLTHQRGFAKYIKGLWYPFGGTRIPATGRVIGVKDRDICIIASEKRSAPGHRLRHEVIARYGDRLDVYGPEHGGAVAHKDILPRYRYAVVIENEQSADWFTEKLIDPLLVGTIPLYCGVPLAEVFGWNEMGWEWGTFERFEYLLNLATQARYEYFVPFIGKNAETAQRYICAEDSIMRLYPDLFEVK